MFSLSSLLLLRSFGRPSLVSRMSSLCAAIDAGTTSTRCFLYPVQQDADGDSGRRRLGARRAEGASRGNSPTSRRDGRYVEQDAELLYANALAVLNETCAKEKQNVVCVGITNQRESLVVWDKWTGRALCPVIVWYDTRTSDLCARMKEQWGGQDAFREVCGLPISTYFTAMKLKYVLDEEEEVRRAVKEGRCMAGTVDTWIIWRLTGGCDGGSHVTDVTNASRTMLMNLRQRSWDENLCTTLGIPPEILPRICSSAERFGVLHTSGNELIEKLQGVPITGCLGDQHAAMLGQGCTEGEAKSTYGTGCFMLQHTGERLVPSTHGLLTTVAFQLGKDAPVEYALEGSVAVAGSGIQWLRDSLGLISSAAESETMASAVEDTAGVYFVPAFNGLFAPHWREDARGTIVGLTSSSTKNHIVRAMLEAVAFQTREVLDAMSLDSGVELARLRVDGGMSQNAQLLQIQADIIGKEVVRPRDVETTARGAGLAAAIGAGLLSRDDALGLTPSSSTGDTSFTSTVTAVNRESRFSKWKMAVQKSLNSDSFI